MHLNSGFDSAQTVVSMYDIIYFCDRSIIYRISVVNCLLVARLRLAFACRLRACDACELALCQKE